MITTEPISIAYLLFITLLSAALSGLLALGSVALGGFLVFRTKREAHERLFQAGAAKGEAFVVDQFTEEAGPVRPGRGMHGFAGSPEPDVASTLLDQQTNRFLDQLKAERVVADQKGTERKVA